MPSSHNDHSAPHYVTFMLALGCGLVAANLYYAQPLVGLIAPTLEMSPSLSGLIVTLTQIGYAMGLLMIVPLGDLLENRKLILTLICFAVFALLVSALTTNPYVFLFAALTIGLGSTAVQIMVPYAAHLAHESVRGRAVGNVMSGLMLGIMLARPISSLLSSLGSWHLIYYVSSVVLVMLIISLRLTLPVRRPLTSLNYGGLLISMAKIAISTPALQRRALYQSALFAGFSLFWTVTPLVLADSFGLDQQGIALFALAGAAGVFAAPIGGRIADKGWIRSTTGLALIGGACAFLMSAFLYLGSTFSLVLLVVSAILLDFCVTTNLVLGQRVIFHLPAEIRSRLNGLFMATFFLGGALGSALGTWSYVSAGWTFSALIGAGLSILAFVYYLSEYRTRPAIVQNAMSSQEESSNL